jgi:uncharacterized membrane protein (UPF0127 family)
VPAAADSNQMTTFVLPLLRNPGDHSLRNERTGTVLATQVLPAFDSASRRTGLLRHTSFPEGHAIIIAPSNAIHTFFMRFAIDVAFVSKDGRVLKIRAAVPPWRIAGALRAYAVVELPAGTLKRTETRRGDRLIVVS